MYIMANDTRYRTSDSAHGRLGERSEPSFGRMGSAQSEVNNSNFSAEDLDMLSSGSSFFDTIAYNRTGTFAEVCRLLGQLVRKIESLGDAFIYALRGLTVFMAAALGIYFIYASFFSTWSDDDLLPFIGTFLLALLIIVFLNVVFSAKTASERAQTVQRYKDGHVRENLSYENSASSRDSLTLNFQNPKRFLFFAVVYAAASVIAIGGILGFLYLMILSLSAEFAHEFLDSVPFFLPILLLLIIAFVGVSWQNTVIGYSLTFDRQGINGKCYYCGHVEKPFIAVYEAPSPNEVTYSDLIRSCGDCVVWENFMCFSYHKNCLVLWKSSQPQLNLREIMLIEFDLYLGIAQEADPRPLRICGSEDEIRELKDFLSGFMPCLPAFGEDYRAII